MNTNSLWRRECKTCQAETLHSAWHCVHCNTSAARFKPLKLTRDQAIALGLTNRRQHDSKSETEKR